MYIFAIVTDAGESVVDERVNFSGKKRRTRDFLFALTCIETRGGGREGGRGNSNEIDEG